MSEHQLSRCCVQSDVAGLPPLGESNYPREAPQALYGSADRLEALGRAYVGLNWVGFLYMILAFGLRDVWIEFRPYTALALVVMFVVSAIGSYFPARNFAIALAWPPILGTVGAVVLGAQSVICCGFLGILALVVVIFSEMGRYGFAGGSNGMRKTWIKVAVMRRREIEAEGAESGGNNAGQFASKSEGG